jgi:hypothetical protein
MVPAIISVGVQKVEAASQKECTLISLVQRFE